MRSLFAFLIVAISAVSAPAQASQLEGTYKATHVMEMLATSHTMGRPLVVFKGPSDCEQSGGVWINDPSARRCAFGGVEDVVQIAKVNGRLAIKIDKVGFDGRTCEFEGPVTNVYSNQLVSVVQGCAVTAIVAGNEVSVSSTEACSTYCGQGLTLDLQATRK